jgi:TPR repeat protein
MYNLANLLASLGEPRILPNARAWWEKAAEAGHAGAMYNLGVLLATQWEPRDLPSARAWWDKAARARCPRSHIA